METSVAVGCSTQLRGERRSGTARSHTPNTLTTCSRKNTLKRNPDELEGIHSYQVLAVLVSRDIWREDGLWF